MSKSKRYAHEGGRMTSWASTCILGDRRDYVRSPPRDEHQARHAQSSLNEIYAQSQ